MKHDKKTKDHIWYCDQNISPVHLWHFYLVQIKMLELQIDISNLFSLFSTYFFLIRWYIYCFWLRNRHAVFMTLHLKRFLGVLIFECAFITLSKIDFTPHNQGYKGSHCKLFPLERRSPLMIKEGRWGRKSQ